MKIKSISLNGFRGSTQSICVPFDTKKKLSLIFGENGTGKSSIIDAFDFICNKSIGSLQNYSVGRSITNYIPSLGKKTDQCNVTLSSDSNDWVASLSGTQITVSPAEGVPDARILRRSAILQLIEQEPKERFNGLKTFISVPQTDKTEKVFRDAISSTLNKFNEATRSFSQAEESLNHTWRDSGADFDSMESWVESISRIEISEDRVFIDSIGSLLVLIDNIISSNLKVSELRTLLSTSTQSLADAEKKLNEYEKNKTESSSDLLTLLQDAKEYISNHDNVGKCPVCETSQDLKKLLEELDKKIDSMDEVKSLAKYVQQARAKFESDRLLLNQAKSEYDTRFSQMIDFLRSCPGSILSSISFPKELVTNYMTDLFTDELFFEWHTQFDNGIRKHIESEKNSKMQNLSLRSTVLQQYETLTNNREQAKLLESRLHLLRSLSEIIVSERKKYIDEILGSISMEVQGLYSMLHPDEAIGYPHFYLKEKAIGSLEFDAIFHDEKSIPPQVYYSESHLDTLGICVFIALAKRYKTDNTILVLDDVLTSVDAQHMDRFMTMLDGQSSVFHQIIITTHYRPWKDRYKYGGGSLGNIDIIELTPWTIHNGIQVSKFIEAVDELRKLLPTVNTERQNIAAKSGILLESMLDFITLQYRCSMQRNTQGEYTLGELVGGIDSKFSEKLEIVKNGNHIKLKPLFDAATRYQWVRNSVGCHFSAIGSDVTDSEIMQFGSSVIMIAETLICNKCGRLPKKNTGEFLKCSCHDNALELHPLTREGKLPGSTENVE